MVDKVSIDAVLTDLRANRECLISNLQDIDVTINCLERLYRVEAKPLCEDPPSTAKELPEIQLSPQKEVQAASVPTNGLECRISPSLRKEANEARPAPSLGLTEAIKRAASENKHDQASLARRAMELRPEGNLNSTQTQIYTLLKSGVLHKGDDLIVRNVENGKVVGLPDLAPKYIASRGKSPYC